MRSMDQEMKKRITSLSDEALVEMLESKPGDYVPEALNIGNQEAERRGGLEFMKSRLNELYRKGEEEKELQSQIHRKEEEKEWEAEVDEIRRRVEITETGNQPQSTQPNHSNSSHPLLWFAITLLVISAAAAIWGYDYTQNHQIVGFGRMIGYKDSTYEIAHWCMNLGIITLLVGIGLLIGSIVKRKQIIVIQQDPKSKCLHIGETGIYCSNCGEKIE